MRQTPVRRTVVGLAAAVLAVTALPALAGDEPSVLAPCAGVKDADRITLAGLSTTTTAPLLPSPQPSAAGRTQPDTERRLVLDLSGSPVGTTAGIGALLTWGQFLNDFDLRVQSGDSSGVSQEVNPTTGTAREETGVGGVGHCQVVSVFVRNYAAVPDSLRLAMTATVEEPEA